MNIDIFQFAENFIGRKLNKALLVEEQYTESDYTIQYWDSKTNKPTILLLNGFGSSTEYQWYKQLDTLSQEHRIILINLLYFGKSKGKIEPKYKIEDQVTSIEKLVKHLQLDKINIMGISYGGLIAAEFCHKNLSKIDKLIIVNAPIKYLTIDHLEKSVIKYGADTIEDFFAPRNAIALKRQFRAAYYSPPYLPNFLLKSFQENLCKPYLKNWKGLIQELRNNVQELSIRQYNFPESTYMIWGEQDEIIPILIGKKLRSEYPKLKLIPIKNAGHLPNIEQSKLFNKELKKILN